MWYLRYVDDILLVLVVPKIQPLPSLIENFEAISVLKFTFQVEVKNKLPFLDCTVMMTSHRPLTGIHNKETSPVECLNYNSFATHRYKTGVIRSMLKRAHKVCSNWDMMHKKIMRSKRMLTNNNFTMSLPSKSQPGISS